MKVKHLIRELGKCDPEAIVTTEGCDCNGDTYCVEVSVGDGPFRQDVYVRRSDAIPGINTGQPYDNTEDTPKPLPFQPRTTPMGAELSCIIGHPGRWILTVDRNMKGILTELP